MSIENSYPNKLLRLVESSENVVIHAEERFGKYRSPAEREFAKEATQRAIKRLHEEDDRYPVIITDPPSSA